MKKTIKMLASAVLLFVLSGCAISPGQEQIVFMGCVLPVSKNYYGGKPFTFETQYTEEEHEERIKGIAEEHGWQTVEVEIVYALDGLPEYFVVETQDFLSDPYYCIGRIVNDEYYIADCGNRGNTQSPYTVAGYATAKKYYGTKFLAVEVDGQLMKIAEYIGDATNYNGWEYLNPVVEVTADEKTECLEKSRSGMIWSNATYHSNRYNG